MTRWDQSDLDLLAMTCMTTKAEIFDDIKICIQMG